LKGVAGTYTLTYNTAVSGDAKLATMKYAVGSTQRPVAGFTREDNGGEYTIYLPVNTQSVTLNAVTSDDDAEIDNATQTVYITGGEGNGAVTVTSPNGHASNKFTVKFVAETSTNSPSVTSLSFASGFTVGSYISDEVFNNRSILFTDRASFTAGHVSGGLKGMSIIRLPITDFRANTGLMPINALKASGSEYFNFVANTAGTLYILGNTNFGNFSTWTNINNSFPPLPIDYATNTAYLSWRIVPEARVISTSPAVTRLQWDNATIRDEGVQTTSTIDYSAPLPYTWTKEFAANETVSVPVPGTNVNGCGMIALIDWDID